ncbi:hypothetical protein ADT35_21480, partial [Yersinia pestis subsp. microtus bv. Talassica]
MRVTVSKGNLLLGSYHAVSGWICSFLSLTPKRIDLWDIDVVLKARRSWQSGLLSNYSWAQELDWLPIPYVYVAKGESLRDLLIDFSANYDATV